MDDIYSATWFVRDYAEYRLVLDESEPMGDEVRIGLIERIFGLDPTSTTVMVPRKYWDEIMRMRMQNGDKGKLQGMSLPATRVDRV